MLWFWLALGAQFLFSSGVHIDKYLISKYFKGAAPGSLIIFSSLFGFVVMPVAYFISPAVFSISFLHIAILIGVGLLNITAVILYLYALSRDEASVVSPLFQMIPIFSYALAFFILGETLSVHQMIAAFLIICGAVFISIDLDIKKFKWIVFGLMAVASLFLALNAVVFKMVALEDSFWISTFWSYASLALAGVILFSFVPSYRKQFINTFKLNKVSVIVVNGINEIIAVFGYVMVSYASLLAPVALVSVVSGFQPLMVFLIGWLLTSLFPHLGQENFSRKQVIQKIVAIVVIFAGTYLLQISS